MATAMAIRPRKRLGEMLMERNLLQPDELDKALAFQKERPEKLGRILVELGFLSARDVLAALSEQLEVPLVAAVSGAQDSVLEAATGYVDRIYVVVPLEGGLEVAQGGVFSYYEFIQPRDQRLTDDEWRDRTDRRSGTTLGRRKESTRALSGILTSAISVGGRPSQA